MPIKLPPVAVTIKAARRPERRKLFAHCTVCGQNYNKDMPEQATYHFTAEHVPWTPRQSA